MPSPNANYGDLLTTTIENRSKVIADNVTKNAALLYLMKKGDKIKEADGGTKLLHELTYQENPNAGWYSGADLLPTSATDVFTAAEYDWKQAAVTILITGREEMINSGEEAMLDLLEERIKNGEDTMVNLTTVGLYSDGTGFGGNQLTGLGLAVPIDPTTGTYGNINRANWTFWRSRKQTATGTLSASTIQGEYNTMQLSLTRGPDQPNLISADVTHFSFYLNSLQLIQRITNPELGQLGFQTVKFLNADVVMDSGIGGAIPAGTSFFLNTKYLKFRPHRKRNFVPLAPEGSQRSFNQDLKASILVFMGNLTCGGAQFQGRFTTV